MTRARRWATLAAVVGAAWALVSCGTDGAAKAPLPAGCDAQCCVKADTELARAVCERPADGCCAGIPRLQCASAGGTWASSRGCAGVDAQCGVTSPQPPGSAAASAAPGGPPPTTRPTATAQAGTQ